METDRQSDPEEVQRPNKLGSNKESVEYLDKRINNLDLDQQATSLAIVQRLDTINQALGQRFDDVEKTMQEYKRAIDDAYNALSARLAKVDTIVDHRLT